MRKFLLAVSLIAGSCVTSYGVSFAQSRSDADRPSTNAQSDIGEDEDAPAVKKSVPPRAKARAKPVAVKPTAPVAQTTPAQAVPAAPASPATPVAQAGAPAPAAPSASAAAASSAPATAPAPPPPQRDVSAALKQNGAGACAPQVEAAANRVMEGVVRSNMVSNWAKTSIDKRLVSVAIGQKYPDGSRVPYTVTSIIAAPSPQGPCDLVAVQVVPSPFSCDKARENFTLVNQTIMGDLAGVLVMRDAGGAQTLLVPTGTNTCVLVGFRAAYAPK